MFKKIIKVLSIILIVFLSIVVIFSLASRMMGITPSAFGNYIFRVSSDSMEPTLMVGDVILVRSADAEDIRKGDIITFKSKEGSMYGREVTHRVVADPEKKNGTYYYQTQGDVKGAPLDQIITYDQIEGKYIRKLALITKVYGFMSTPLGVAVLIGVIVVLFGYEMIAMLISNKKLDEIDDAIDKSEQ